MTDQNNQKVTITDRAVSRYLNHIDPRLKHLPKVDQVRQAKKDILKYFGQSVYISDDATGILFRNRVQLVQFIVKHRKIETVIKLKNERKN